MSGFIETPVLFASAQTGAQAIAQTIGICALPPQHGELGVLIVVGGPQYRVGSHRQFTLLSRALAARGMAVMRFDFAGTGDSPGEDLGTSSSFEQRDAEISCAIDAFFAQVPGLRKVVLWGLCDGASAALMYAPSDARVAGLVLLNPWVRSEASLAKTHLKHYYTARLRDPAFWRKLVSGDMVFGQVLGSFVSALQRVLQRKPGKADAVHRPGFQTRMAQAWRSFYSKADGPGPILLLISGTDLTAKEFLQHADSDAAWRGLLVLPNVSRHDLAKADHTFSSAPWRDQVADWTAQWLMQIERLHGHAVNADQSADKHAANATSSQ